MILEIFPDKGFKLNSDSFNWNDARKSVREKLKNQHKEDDNVMEMSDFFGGDTSHDIIQKRDIYKDINEMKNYFFLMYDKENRLNELEIHWGIDTKVDNVHMEFDKDINLYLNELKSKGYEINEIEEGNYLFKRLKITIANSESIGGEGNGLSYLYAGKDIEHLTEN